MKKGKPARGKKTMPLNQQPTLSLVLAVGDTVGWCPGSWTVSLVGAMAQNVLEETITLLGTTFKIQL